MKYGAGFSGWGIRKTASVELLSRGRWSVDAGVTDKREALAALGFERGKFGLQAGGIMDLTSKARPRTWFAGGTVRF